MMIHLTGYDSCEIAEAMANFKTILNSCFKSSCIIKHGDGFIIDKVVMEDSNSMDWVKNNRSESS